MKEVIVVSLGGSLIVPDDINYRYLKEFKKVILKYSKKFKFVIVCGGGSVARKYISAIAKEQKSHKLQSFAGISVTRMNARFVSYFFGLDPERGIPHKISEVKKYLRKQDVVFCGALEYKPHQTSDTTAASIAKKFNAEFVNLTDIKGLFDKNPKKFKNAIFIPRIGWRNFHKRAAEIKFKPGQHFVLDQSASKIILENKIPTYIIGSVKQFENFLKGIGFVGTEIRD
jgi:uridylate kinase